MDQDVNAAETIHDRLDDLIDPCARTDVCLDEPIERAAGGQGSCGGDQLSTSAHEALHNGFANALGPTRNQDSSALEIGCFSCLRLILHKHLLVSSKPMPAWQRSSRAPQALELIGHVAGRP